MLEAAKAAYGAGVCVVPPRDDGSKRPIEAWKDYQIERPTREQMGVWFGNSRTGIGFVCGAVSGNLELFEFDDEPTYAALLALADEAGLEDLVRRIEDGYLEATPGGGVHWFYRCDEIAGNTKLARRRKTPEEMTGPDDKIKVLIETRGEGGYAVVAPSNGVVHPSGLPYRLLAGGPDRIATITPAERESLWELARSFDRMPRNVVVDRTDAQDPGWVTRPGDAFATSTDWAEILEPHGWTRVFAKGDTTYWRRPGKTHGVSASTNHAGSDLLYVFSTSTVLDAERGYGKFAAVAMLEHAGDFKAAARALHDEGYGEKETTPQADVVTEWTPQPEKLWPTPMGVAAFHGLAGEIVTAMDPYTEADPHALLVSVLTAFGCQLGPGPHMMIGATQHAPRLFVLMLGRSSWARKGSSWDPVRAIVVASEGEFVPRMQSGLSSGEGLIAAVRDPKYGLVKGALVMTEPGIEDKRLLVVETEFGAVLTRLKRDTNTLSAVIRAAWDGGDLRVATKEPLVATAPHVALIAHITPAELREKLASGDISNGMANRFLPVLIRRARRLPRPDPLDGPVLMGLATRWRNAVQVARKIGRVGWSDEAGQQWDVVYARLAPEKESQVADLTARAAPIICRVAMLYALLDGVALIEPAHLAAALEVWQYAVRGVEYLFGDTTSAKNSDQILRHLHRLPAHEMDAADIYKLFSGRIVQYEVYEAMEELEALGLVTYRRELTLGRSRHIWTLAKKESRHRAFD